MKEEQTTHNPNKDEIILFTNDKNISFKNIFFGVFGFIFIWCLSFGLIIYFDLGNFVKEAFGLFLFLLISSFVFLTILKFFKFISVWFDAFWHL